jgi:peptidoglycan hydrolase-like protein with peptidoglycan-binding domain
VPHLRRIVVPALITGMFVVPAAAAAATTGGATPTAAATTAPRITARVLLPGAKGADVSRLQQLLIAVGIGGAATGNYDYVTSRSVQRFQVAAGLQPSGIAGPATIAALRGAADGPKTGQASGGMDFGSTVADTTRLGARIPLAAGMSGRDVRQMQDYLRRAGITTAPAPSGEFGSLTVAAVKRFEAREHRLVDGRLDAGDIYALFKIVGQDALPGAVGDPSQGLPPAPLAPGDKATVSASGQAIAPENAPDAVKQIIAAGNRIATLPYKWGGGHGSWQDSGYDCSGSVSYALHGAGLLSSPEDSTALESYGEPGPGREVTIYANSEHAFMVVGGKRFDTVALAETGNRWSDSMTSTAGFVARHPAGL